MNVEQAVAWNLIVVSILVLVLSAKSMDLASGALMLLTSASLVFWVAYSVLSVVFL